MFTGSDPKGIGGLTPKHHPGIKRYKDPNIIFAFFKMFRGLTPKHHKDLSITLVYFSFDDYNEERYYLNNQINSRHYFFYSIPFLFIFS